MEIEEALVAYLLADSALAALIGAKIYPDEIPQGVTYPAVFYLDISSVPLHTLVGQSVIDRPSKQFTVYASTKASAKAVANRLKALLSDYQGTLSGLEIQKIELQNELSGKYRNSDGTLPICTHDLEYQIFYRRS